MSILPAGPPDGTHPSPDETLGTGHRDTKIGGHDRRHTLKHVNDVHAWKVPGRVNLMGEHLDYNGGSVLPMAIDRALLIKARLRTDHEIRLWSNGQTAQLSSSAEPGETHGWARYPAAALWSARQAGIATPGMDIVIESQLPAGAGLSSSAALLSGVTLALHSLSGLAIDTAQVAELAHRAEVDFIGAPVGRMDHAAVLDCSAGHATLIDCGTQPINQTPVRLDWPDHALQLLVINTKTRHEIAQGEYATRRHECDEISQSLGLTHLAGARVDALLRTDDAQLKRRLRHVITESARVRATVTALTLAKWNQFGSLLTASHESLRDDFEVSCTELDAVVSTALESGALGAKMTGGGFGGCVIALVESARTETIKQSITELYMSRGWAAPEIFPVRPSAGAVRLQ